MAITKEMLRHASVIGQLDQRWIAARLGGVVALVDQHAADERVRLEELLAAHITADGDPLNLRTQRLEPPEDLDLTEAEVALIGHHDAALRRWGWEVGSQFGAAPMRLHTVPVVGSHVLRARAMREFLALQSSLGGGTAPPRAVLRALVSKACRTAIMFGRQLSQRECAALLSRLGQTNFPFQCAHGRPTIVPVLDLASKARPRRAARLSGLCSPW